MGRKIILAALLASLAAPAFAAEADNIAAAVTGTWRNPAGGTCEAAYFKTAARTNRALFVPLQCLLKQQHLYRYEVTGVWNRQTLTALHLAQRQAGYALHPYVSRNLWEVLLTTGNARTVLRYGVKGPDVTRVQRALNAAADPRLKISGTYGAGTRRAVAAFQSAVGIKASGVVGSRTWRAFEEGRR